MKLNLDFANKVPKEANYNEIILVKDKANKSKIYIVRYFIILVYCVTNPNTHKIGIKYMRPQIGTNA